MACALHGAVPQESVCPHGHSGTVRLFAHARPCCCVLRGTVAHGFRSHSLKQRTAKGKGLIAGAGFKAMEVAKPQLRITGPWSDGSDSDVDLQAVCRSGPPGSSAHPPS